MSTFFLFCTALLLSAPLAALAQTTDAAPDYRFYGGVAVYTSGSQSLGGYYGSRYNVPVQTTLGYQLLPRLAVQVGLAYSNVKSNDSNSHDYLDANSTIITYLNSNDYARRAVTTSVLARYTLTRKATHRFQVDVLGGPSFYHSTGHSSYSETATSQGSSTVSYYDYTYNYNSLLVNAGPSFRYRFGKHIEAMYDVLFSASLTDNLYGNTSMALGLRYRFGGLH